MKKIPLGHGKFAIVDDADFKRVIVLKWYCSHGYAVRNRNGKSQHRFMHRMILHTPDDLITDHINGMKLDNRKRNLRSATKSQNALNAGAHKNSKTGIRGVVWRKERNKFQASMCVSGKWKHLGYFKTLRGANRAYKMAIKNASGRFIYGA